MSPTMGAVASTGLVTEQFLAVAEATGDDVMFVDDERSVTGTDAMRAARALAHHLSTTTDDQAVVAFFCGGSARHAIAWFAALHAGRIACNLHLRETPEKIATILKWLEPQAVVFDEESAELAARSVELAELEGVQRLCLGDERSDGSSSGHLSFGDITARVDVDAMPAPRPDAVAAILLSSGTTGEPKGIVHTHETLTQAAVHGRVPWEIADGTRLLLYLQPSFAAWAVLTLPAVTGGATVIYSRQFSPMGFLEQCERERVTHAALVPTMSRMIVAADTSAHDLSSLKFVSLGGEAPSRDDVEQLAAKVCDNIVVAYLASETLPASAVYGSGVDLARRGKTGSTGRPGPGVEIKIIDPEGDFDGVQPAGTQGEIVVRGASNAVGYWKAPELTEQRFRDGWWRSGDLGLVDGDGDVWVQGRSDNIINTGGIKVSGEEVENALLSHPGVVNCAVVGQPDAQFGQRIEAYIVAAGDPPAPDDLDRYLRYDRALSGFKVPKQFHLLDELPIGPTGKLHRRGLRRTDSS